MRKFFFFALAFCGILPSLASAQDLRLPRDPQKLIERAQAFWASLVAGRRLEAIGFVLPEKKETFLAGSPTPIIAAQVLGLDLASDAEHAQVRTRIEALGKDAIAPRAGWVITDPWVWQRDNWYLDIHDAPDIFPRRSIADEEDIEATAKKIDQSFEFLRNPVDLGRLIDGQQLSLDIPIRYSGDVPVSAESELANPLADLDATSSNQITSQTDHIVLLVNTEGWEGPFDLPLPVRIRNGAAVVKRRLVIRGTVFAPVTFRRNPPHSSIEPGQPLSVVVRNNSSVETKVAGVRTDGKFDVVKQPEFLRPNAEAEIVLQLKPGESPDRLYLLLEMPIEGRRTFTYRFQE